MKKRVKPEIIDYSVVVDVLCELFNQSYSDEDWKECRLTITKLWDVVKAEKGEDEAQRVVNPFAQKLKAIK